MSLPREMELLRAGMEHLTVLSELTFSSENQSCSKTSPKIQCEVRVCGNIYGTKLSTEKDTHATA